MSEIESGELDVEDIVACEGCATLLHPEFANFDSEGVALCDDCWAAL